MGVTGNLGPEDIIDILVAHPETAANLSTELFQFFGYPNPSPGHGRTASRRSTSTAGTASRRWCRRYSPPLSSSRHQAYLANVKSPAEYVATAVRSLGATANMNGAVTAMGNMGQDLFNPPCVFGWPSG